MREGEGERDNERRRGREREIMREGERALIRDKSHSWMRACDRAPSSGPSLGPEMV